MFSYLFTSTNAKAPMFQETLDHEEIKRAEQLSTEGKYEEAILIYSKLIQKAKGDKSALWAIYLKRSQAFLAQGKFELALFEAKCASDLQQESEEKFSKIAGPSEIRKHWNKPLQEYLQHLQLVEIEKATFPSHPAFTDDLKMKINSLLQKQGEQSEEKSQLIKSLHDGLDKRTEENSLRKAGLSWFNRLLSKIFLYTKDIKGALAIAEQAHTEMLNEYNTPGSMRSKELNDVCIKNIRDSLKYLNALQSALKIELTAPSPLTTIGFHASKPKLKLNVKSNDAELQDVNFFTPPTL